MSQGMPVSPARPADTDRHVSPRRLDYASPGTPGQLPATHEANMEEAAQNLRLALGHAQKIITHRENLLSAAQAHEEEESRIREELKARWLTSPGTQQGASTPAAAYPPGPPGATPGSESRHISPSPTGAVRGDVQRKGSRSESPSAPAGAGASPYVPFLSEYPSWRALQNQKNEALRREVDDLAAQVAREQLGGPRPPRPAHVGGLADMFPTGGGVRPLKLPQHPPPPPHSQQYQAAAAAAAAAAAESPAHTATDSPRVSPPRPHPAGRSALPSQRLVAEREAWLERAAEAAAADGEGQPRGGETTEDEDTTQPGEGEPMVEQAKYDALKGERDALMEQLHSMEASDDKRVEKIRELEGAVKNLTVQNAELSHLLARAQAEAAAGPDVRKLQADVKKLRAENKALKEEMRGREADWDRARHDAARYLNSLKLAQAELGALQAERALNTEGASAAREALLTQELDALAGVIRDLQSQLEDERARNAKMQIDFNDALAADRVTTPRTPRAASLCSNEQTVAVTPQRVNLGSLHESTTSLVVHKRPPTPPAAHVSTVLTAHEASMLTTASPVALADEPVRLSGSFYNSSMPRIAPAAAPRPLEQDIVEEEELERLRRERDGWRVGWVGACKALHRWSVAAADREADSNAMKTRLTQQRDTFQQQRDAAQEQLDDANRQLFDLTRRVGELEKSNRLLERELEKEKAAAAEPAPPTADPHLATIASQEAIIGELRKECARQAGELVASETQNEMKAAQIQALTAANQTLLDLAKASEERELVSRAGVSPAELEGLREELHAVEQSLEKAQQDNTELKRQIRGFKETIAEGDAQLAAQTDETTELQRERDRLLEQVANMAAELDASVAQQQQLAGVKDEMIAMLKADLEAVREQLDGPTLLSFGVQTEVPTRTVGCLAVEYTDGVDLAEELREAKRDLAERQTEIASLTEDIDRVEARRQEAERLMQEAVQLAADAEARAVQADAIAEEALQTTQADQTAISKLKAALQQRDAAVDDLQRQLDDAVADHAAAQDECDTLARSASELANQLAEHKEQVQQLQEELDLRAGDMAARDNELLRLDAQHDADVVRLEAQRDAEEQKLARALADVEELEEKVAVLRDENRDLQGRLDAAAAEDVRKDRERHDLDRQYEDCERRLEDDLRRLEDEVKRLDDMNQTLQSTLALREAELEAATARTEEAVAELELLQSQTSAERNRMQADLDQSRETFLVDLRDAQQRGESVESQLAKQARKNAELTEELKRVLAENGELRDQLIRTNEETEATLKAMADKSEAMEVLATKAIKEAKQARDASRTDLQARNETLAEELKEARDRSAALQDASADLERSNEALQQSNKELEVSRDALQAELAQRDQELLSKQREHAATLEAMEKMQADAEALLQDLAATTDQLVAAREEKDRLIQEVAGLKEKVSAAIARSSNQAARDLDDLRTITDERDALRARAAELSGKASGLEERIVELEMQRKAQDTFIETWQRQPLQLAKEHDVLEVQKLEGQLADVMNMLRSTEASLEDEIARNGRLEDRIEMCVAHLKEAEQDRIARAEELRAIREERAQLRNQVRSLMGNQSTSDREKRDLLSKLDQFGWLIGQRGAFTKDLHKLHKMLTSLANMTDMSRRVKAQTSTAQQHMMFILNTYLSEVERRHLGLKVIVHPSPEPQSLSPRALLRLLEHSPLTQGMGGGRADGLEPSPYRP